MCKKKSCNEPKKYRRDIKEFDELYGLFDKDCRLPVIVSVLAQDDESMVSHNFAPNLDKEIKRLLEEVKNAPVYFLIQGCNHAELNIARWLSINNYNVIFTGAQSDYPLDINASYLNSDEPIGLMLECSWKAFAFWDGKIGSEKGKPVEDAVISFLKGGAGYAKSNKRYKVEFPNGCPIVHFPLKRKDIEIKNPFEARYLYPHFAESGTNWYYITAENVNKGDKKAKNKKLTFEKNNKTLSGFNKHLEKCHTKLKARPKIELDDLLKDLFADNKRINDARARFAFYDRFAMVNQTRRNRQSYLLINLAAVALVLFAIFDNLWSQLHLLLLYGALFIALFVILWFVNRSRAHENYIFGRVLAEATRSQTYLYAIGDDKSVRSRFPISHRSDLGWLYTCVNALHVVNRSIGGDIGSADNLSEVKKRWIGLESYNAKTDTYAIEDWGQYHYFSSKGKEKKKKSNHSLAIVFLLSVLSFLMSVVLILVVAIPKLISGINEDIPRLLLFGLDLAPIFIAWPTTISSVKFYREEATRHAWSEIIAKRVLTDLEVNTDKKVQLEILEEFGNEMINENGDWAIMKLGHRPEIIKN